MPLRDLFRPPISKLVSWEGFHAVLPTFIVVNLNRVLPPRYRVEARVNLGEADGSEQYEYAVLVLDQEHDRRLVAAVQIVSPGNQDRPQACRALVRKCASLLRHGSAITMIDLGTVPHLNPYAELLEWIGQPQAAAIVPPGTPYAASLRVHSAPPRFQLQTWHFTLALGQRLPTLPLWLSPGLAVPVDLEASYEDACRTCRIG